MALSKHLKSSMVGAMVNHAICGENSAIQRDWREFGMKVYCDVFDEALRKKLNDIPHEYLCVGSSIKVKLGNKTPSLNIGKTLPGKREQQWECQKDYGYHHEFVAQFDELEQRQRDLDDKRKILTAQAKAIIEGVPSFSRLWKVWPECHPILKHFEGEKPMPVAVIMPEVNAAFGLPVEQGGAV